MPALGINTMSKDVEAIGDIVDGTKYNTSGSPADEYYRYENLKRKIGSSGLSSGEQTKVLQAVSEREGIELKILAKLADITESSPEFAQVYDLTGTRDKFEQAQRLAQVVYDKVRAEAILGFYTPDKTTLLNHFRERTLPAAQLRTTAVGTLGQESSVAARITSGIAAALGIRS